MKSKIAELDFVRGGAHRHGDGSGLGMGRKRGVGYGEKRRSLLRRVKLIIGASEKECLGEDETAHVGAL